MGNRGWKGKGNYIGEKMCEGNETHDCGAAANLELDDVNHAPLETFHE